MHNNHLHHSKWGVPVQKTAPRNIYNHCPLALYTKTPHEIVEESSVPQFPSLWYWFRAVFPPNITTSIRQTSTKWVVVHLNKKRWRSLCSTGIPILRNILLISAMIATRYFPKEITNPGMSGRKFGPVGWQSFRETPFLPFFEALLTTRTGVVGWSGRFTACHIR